MNAEYFEHDMQALRDHRDELLALLAMVDHTLTVHGHIDADTPLHERVREAADNPLPLAAVDPHATDPGTPTPREERLL